MSVFSVYCFQFRYSVMIRRPVHQHISISVNWDVQSVQFRLLSQQLATKWSHSGNSCGDSERWLDVQQPAVWVCLISLSVQRYMGHIRLRFTKNGPLAIQSFPWSSRIMWQYDNKLGVYRWMYVLYIGPLRWERKWVNRGSFVNPRPTGVFL